MDFLSTFISLTSYSSSSGYVGLAGFGSSQTSQTSVWSGFNKVHLGQNHCLGTGGGASFSSSSYCSSKSFWSKDLNPSYKIITYPDDNSFISLAIYKSSSGIRIFILC